MGNSFEGIIEFVAVAESQGFSAAAKLLGCSTSHVSRQVSRLESSLGSALLSRSTRMVNLTDAGLLYYRQCKDLVNGLEQANEQVRYQQFQLNGTLRISAAGSFAEQHVSKALLEFANKHPDLHIHMDFNSRLTNFIEDGTDFAIRYGKLEDSGLVARKLLDRTMMAAASPQYLEQYGTPKHPEQLKHHLCIISNRDHWQFESKEGNHTIKINGRWRSNSAHAAVSACEHGMGIAYMPKSSFLSSVEQGNLIPVLEPFWSQGASSWIVYQNRQFLPLRARLAIDYLLEYFADWQE